MQTSIARLASNQQKAAAFLALKQYEVSVLKTPTSAPSHHFLPDARKYQESYVVSVSNGSDTTELEIPSFSSTSIQVAGEGVENISISAAEKAWEVSVGGSSVFMPYPPNYYARQLATEKARPAHWGPHGPLTPAEKAAQETAARAEEILSGVSNGGSVSGHVAPPGKVVVAYVYADDPNATGGAAAGGGQVVGVKTNMHGKVVKVNAKLGEAVKKGDSLAVLEAMKMETILRAPCDGIVRAVRAKEGETVQQGVIVVTIEQSASA